MAEFLSWKVVARFSSRSQNNLDSCHADLITLFEEVVKSFDCSIICGFRSEEGQTNVYMTGKSQTRWPDSKHNKTPSMAVDAVPYPFDWKDREGFTLFAGYVLGIAHTLKQQGKISHCVRWGGDWNMNHNLADNTFDDLVHFELR